MNKPLMRLVVFHVQACASFRRRHFPLTLMLQLVSSFVYYFVFFMEICFEGRELYGLQTNFWVTLITYMGVYFGIVSFLLFNFV